MGRIAGEKAPSSASASAAAAAPAPGSSLYVEPGQGTSPARSPAKAASRPSG
ncbi:unnamed protein product [Spirodela intermedia]|uniref:Uncharacterized protein n=1 Tax=Spirodela intermedia TaxID=51605 RepID=A0A7I8JHR2_SPIIN|nr:unnamed protein product [Spirodela intermedia]CAA6669709.1 unnamed protein product [Spirodela intermedia]